MHWFVWTLLIIFCVDIGVVSARIGGYKPQPTNPWVSLLVYGLLVAGTIAYLT